MIDSVDELFLSAIVYLCSYGVSSFCGCLGKAALFYRGTPIQYKNLEHVLINLIGLTSQVCLTCEIPIEDQESTTVFL